MENKKHKQRLAILFLFIVISLFFPIQGLAYNWPWDQGHDCVKGQGGISGWGRWGYDGVMHGEFTTKECCELFCKICPVYANTGRLQKTYTDLTIPGVGPVLTIIRTYDSQDWATSLLGHGWIFNFGRELIIIRNKAGEKIIGVRLETGEKNFFKENPDGTLEQLTAYGVNYDLIKNPDGTYTIKNRDGSRHELRSDGKISNIVDKNNNQMTFEYSSVGCLSKITNASGNYVAFQLGPNGKIASISDNLGRTIVYSYDQNGNLISFANPMGNITQYVYNSDYLLTQIIDPRGNTVESATYDTNQPPRVSTFSEKGETYTIAYYSDHTIKTDSSGNAWTYYFNDVGVITKAIDPLGNVTEQLPNKVTSTSLDWKADANGNITHFTYDANGNITSRTDPLGNITTYTYIPGTNFIATETNPLGVVTKYEYDVNGSQIKIIRDFGGALQNTTTYSYDIKGNQTSVTEPLGNTTRYEYDANGNLIKVTDPLGNVTTYTYDSRGNKLTETNANSNTTTYAYDLMNRLVSVTDALGNTATYAYDANGNRTSVQYPDGNKTTFAYDTYNRLIQETDPLGSSKTFMYDKNDNILTATDANGNSTAYTYDSLGRKKLMINALGNQTQITYDFNGNLISITDANGYTTTFSYDSANRIIKKTYHDGANYIYAYDVVGNKSSEKDANGNTTVFTFDRLNRSITKTYADGSTSNYTYDLLGRMLTGTNSDSNISYTYDALNRISTASLNGKTINYTYDAVGNRITMTTPEGEIIRYTYNHGNLMSRIELSSGKGINYNYDSVYRITRKDYSGGNYSTYNFDIAGRLTQLKHLKSDASEIYTQINTFDNAGNILLKTTNLGVTNYTYDKLYQLISASHPTMPQESFTYDKVGNRVTSADYNDWSYNNRNQLTGYNGLSFTYDSNGNAITKTDSSGTTKYIYDYENRLKRIDFPNGSYITYKYDVYSRRIEKNINGNIIINLYDGMFLLAEYDAYSNLIRNYFNGTGGDFNPSIVYENSKVYFVYYDHLNTAKMITDASSEVFWSANFNSYGGINILFEKIIYNFRFPGQYSDSESGLYYNGNRYYQSDIGRYMTEDPDQSSINLYIYSDNNPINKVDPLGLKVQVCIRPLQIDPWWDALGYLTYPAIWATFRLNAKHCDIKITSPGYQNWGFFGTNKVGNPPPPPIGGTCKDAIGNGNEQNCWDKCVNGAAAAGGNKNFNLFTHNCCHWAREIISSCGLKFPFPNVNWPFNPGS